MNASKNFRSVISMTIICLITFIFIIPANAFEHSYKVKRPIPQSPSPIDQPEKDKKPKELQNKRTKNSKKYAYPNGLFVTKYYPKAIHKRGDKGGWEDIGPNDGLLHLLKMVDPIPLSLCLYGAGSSFNETGNKSNNQLSLYHYTQNNVTFRSNTYLRFPNLRDLIPPSATLTDVSLIVTDDAPSSSPFSVSAFAITQSWNPSTVTGTGLPSVSGTASATNEWDLDTDTPRADRSLDITDLAELWFSGASSDFGVYLTVPDADTSQNGAMLLDLPVLVVKYTDTVAPSDPSFGGSYYTDNMCPPVLVPGRAVLVDRIGDINNPIHSYVFTEFDYNTMNPYGEDILGTYLKFGDVSPYGNNIPMEKTKPYSNTCYNSYTFPPVNGDPSEDEDIYPNYALSATDPSNDPNPPGLLPSPPHLSDSLPFLNLTSGSSRNDGIDISALVNTPIHPAKYPNYPLTDFTSVFEIDHSLLSAQTSIQVAMSSLPSISTLSSLDVGADGELETQFDIFPIDTAASSTGNFQVSVNAYNGAVNAGVRMGYEFGFNGCLHLVPVHNVFSTSSSVYNDCTYLEPAPSTAVGAIVLRSSTGSQTIFSPVYDNSGVVTATRYNTKITNLSLITHIANPSAERYELINQSGSISQYFDENGRITKYTSREGGEVVYNRDTTDPDKVLSIEDSYSGRSLDYTYDQYDRLVEVTDAMDRQLQYQYDQNNQVTRIIDPMNRSYWLNRGANGDLSSVSVTTPNITTPKTLFSVTYAPTPSSINNGNYYIQSIDNKISSVTNSCGLTAEITIDETNRTSSITDPSGRTVTFTYYPDGTIKSVTDDSEKTDTFYPASELATGATEEAKTCFGDENSGTTSVTYDEERRIVEVVDAMDNLKIYEYNEDNQIISATNEEDQETTTSYTQDGLVQTITLSSGKELSYSYNQDKQVTAKTTSYKENNDVTYSYTHDANGYIASTTDPLQKTSYSTFDDLGRLTQEIDPLGRTTSYVYDFDSNITEITIAQNTTEKSLSLVYDDLGKLLSVTDAANHATTYTYDECGFLSDITNALNQTTHYDYNTAGLLWKVTDPKNHVTEYTYDLYKRMTSVKDPLGKITTYDYDERGNLAQVTDPLDHSVQYEYDITGRVTKMIDPLENEQTYTYSPLGKILTITDANDHTYTMTYNDFNQLATVTDPLNQVTSYTYFPFGAIQSKTNALNQTTTYDYDAVFRLISVTDFQNREMTYEYNDVDRVSSITDSADRTTSYEYDIFNNVTQITNPLNQVTSFEYDVCNNKTAVITPMEERYEYTYDALHRVITATDPLDHTKTYTYDAAGNLDSFEDPLEHLTQWQHDVRDLMNQTTDALDQISLNDYDDAKRLTEVTDELERITSLTYDANSRLTEITSPLDHSVQYAYDALGSLLSITRPATTGQNGTVANVNEFSYDVLDRVSTITDPFDNVQTYTYNTLSQITEVELFDSNTLTYTYDTYNRLSELETSDTHSINYTYDTLDRVTEVEDSITGSFTYEYDTLDRVTEVEGPDNKTLTMEYDDDSRLVESVWDSQTYTYTYDDASRLTETSAPGSRTYTATYDAADRQTKQTLPPEVDANWLYDAINRITSFTYTKPDEEMLSRQSLFMSVAQLAKIILEYKFDQGKVNLLAEKYGAKSEQVWRERVATNNRFKQKLLDPITIASFVPTYNAVSRITQEVKTIDQTQKTYSFTRDDEDQIVTATYPNSTSYAWTYDERNNRTSQRTVTASTDITETYIYNKADQLTSMEKRNTSNQQLLESYSYSYDNIGQMVTKTKTSVTPNEVTEYDYYVGGNLKQVTLPDDSEITFLYDAYGNRIQKATPDEVITYQYAAGSLRREIHKDDTNTTTLYTLNYYPWGLEKVVPAQGEDPEVVTPYYYVYDQKGFVQAIMDNDGDIVESYEYSPFGELLTTPTVTQFRFLSGREECIWDPETKLYYMHARYYDPVLGRFQTQDSMRGSMGSPISLNRYIYCQNDPVSLVDPSGNSPFNTGLPERWWEPGDQRLIDFTDSCTLPEIDHGSVRDGYLIEPMGPQCTVAYTDGVNVWVVSKFLLASGESVDINVLIGKKNKDGKTIDATLAEMKAFLLKQKQENIYGPLEGFIDGLIEGIEALYNGVLKIGEDGFSKILTSAVNESNLINKECWSDFQTEYTGSVNKYKPFAKHSIIGGYLATQISNASCLGVDTATQNRWNRYIGFAVSFMYEKSPRQNININNGAGKSDVIDLVGIANLCKGMALAEYQLRSEKARVGRGSFNDPKNIMNCNKDWWHKEDGTGNDNSHYMKGSFNDLTFDDICNSEFLSAIAGVSVLFSAADLLENDKTAFSRRKDRPANNSVFFWLESARRFSCGPNNTMNWYNRITTEKYLYFYSKLESKRYRESMAAFAGYWGIFPK